MLHTNHLQQPKIDFFVLLRLTIVYSRHIVGPGLTVSLQTYKWRIVKLAVYKNITMCRCFIGT